MKIGLKIKLQEGVSLPLYGSEESAGFDLVAHSFKSVWKGDKEVIQVLKNSQENGYIMLRPFERVLVGCGFSVELPVGYELQVRSRSGNALKKGLTILNSPGTIDSDYRGEVGAIIYNSTKFLMKVSIGDKVAQAVLTTHDRVSYWMPVDELSFSDRGEGGFGSTDGKVDGRLFEDEEVPKLQGEGKVTNTNLINPDWEKKDTPGFRLKSANLGVITTDEAGKTTWETLAGTAPLDKVEGMMSYEEAAELSRKGSALEKSAISNSGNLPEEPKIDIK